MAEGRARQLWAHTSQLLSKIHNANLGPDGKPLYPDDFNPFRQKLARRRRRERQAAAALELKDSLPLIKCKVQKD